MPRRNSPRDVFKHIDMTATEVRKGMTTPCWPWTGGLSASGRPYFNVDGKKVLAYRLVYELVTGDVLGDRIAMHQCDNEICCRHDHIKPGDHQQNMDEMKERERHGLPHHVVTAIRTLSTGGRTHKEIAALYGIGRSTVTEIVNKVNYGGVAPSKERSSKDTQGEG